MEYTILFDAIHRHLDETKLLIDQLTDNVLLKSPVQTGRSLGDIIMHLIRSLEYYTQGLSINVCKPLDYTLEKYSTSSDVKELYKKVFTKTKTYLNEIDRETLDFTHEGGNRQAKRVDVLLEMLEHSIQHRGQILVYFRLLGIEPAKIPYII